MVRAGGGGGECLYKYSFVEYVTKRRPRGLFFSGSEIFPIYIYIYIYLFI
jgi:hypothetical protein